MDRAVLDEYLKADRMEKDGKNLKAKLRPQVVAFFKEYGQQDDCSYTTYSTTTLHYDKILEWVKETYPEFAGSLVIQKEELDIAGFEQLVKEGKIDFNLLPEHCTSETPGDRITPTPAGKNNA